MSREIIEQIAEEIGWSVSGTLADLHLVDEVGWMVQHNPHKWDVHSDGDPTKVKRNLESCNLRWTIRVYASNGSVLVAYYKTTAAEILNEWRRRGRDAVLNALKEEFFQ